MNSTTWRTALLATGAVLAATSLLIAGCSKGGGDMSDSSGSDPNIPASTSPSSSSSASGPGAGSGAATASTDTSSSTVSSAGVISPGAGLTNDTSTIGSSPSPPPPPSSATSAGPPGRATGPRS